MITLVLATRNAHKVAEIRSILSAQFHYVTLADLPNAPSVVEDASSFAGNAAKKAVQLAEWLVTGASLLNTLKHGAGGEHARAFVLTDDSGLEVDALGGAPGIHSARFAALDSGVAGNSPDAANNAKLLRLLERVPLSKRSARFCCVIALAPIIGPQATHSSPVCHANDVEMQTQLFEGTCEGRIAETPSGSGGFGYDPLFIPEGFEQSFASLGEPAKNRISHRGRALAKVAAFLESLDFS